MRRWFVAILVLGLLLALACTTDPKTQPSAHVVGGAWVVEFPDGRVCFQLDLYHHPDMDEPREAIAACRQHLAEEPD